MRLPKSSLTAPGGRNSSVTSGPGILPWLFPIGLAYLGKIWRSPCDSICSEPRKVDLVRRCGVRIPSLRGINPCRCTQGLLPEGEII